jgi:hypothetical protein
MLHRGILNNFFRAYKRVQAWLGKELSLRPALDFDGAFFAIAVKEGVSEKLHIDFNDGKKQSHGFGQWEIGKGQNSPHLS